MSRSSLAEKQFDQAMGYAKETKSLTIGLLKGKSLDSDEHLATALGAAYEVQSQALAKQGQIAPATTLLQWALGTDGKTSSAPLLENNRNLMTLVGRPAPSLLGSEYLGAK